MKDDKTGYVYILTNPSFREDWVKIGKSSRPVAERLKELDNTSVPLPFEIYATLKTSKYNEAEKLVHRYIGRFTDLRIRSNREYFKVQPEIALEIFRDIALVLGDAEIDEVYKDSVTGADIKEDKDNRRDKSEGNKVWMIPYNNKFFDLKSCIEKYGYVYWSQYFNFKTGDTGYIYSSRPDSAIRYKYVVEEAELSYSPEMDKEIEFYVDANDFVTAKNHNRFCRIRIIGESKSPKLTLVNLLDNGMRMAPRGCLNLSYKDYEGLLKYIEDNF